MGRNMVLVVFWAVLVGCSFQDPQDEGKQTLKNKNEGPSFSEFKPEILDGKHRGWEGRAVAEWLGGEIEVTAESIPGENADVMPEVQRQMIAVACKQPHKAKKILEEFLFAYYKNEVLETLPEDAEYAPDLKESHEIWSLVSEPFLHIPSAEMISDKYQFVLMFEADWDPENGIAVTYGENGPIAVDEQSAHYYY